MVEPDGPEHEGAPGRPEQVDRAGRGGGGSAARGGLLGQLGDGLLDERLAVARGEVARGHVVAVGDGPGVVEHDDALRDHREGAGQAGLGDRALAAAQDGAVDRPLDHRRRLGQPGAARHDVVRQPLAGRDQAPGQALLADEGEGEGDHEDGHQDGQHGRHRVGLRRRGGHVDATGGLGGQASGARVLGQPARDHVLHPLADVHGVVADALVVAPDQRQLHGHLHVAHVGVDLEDRLDVVLVQLVEPVVHVVEGAGEVGVAVARTRPWPAGRGARPGRPWPAAGCAAAAAPRRRTGGEWPWPRSP